MVLLCHKLRSLDRRFTPVSPNLTLETFEVRDTYGV
jgi:hypothetical protein